MVSNKSRRCLAWVLALALITSSLFGLVSVATAEVSIDPIEVDPEELVLVSTSTSVIDTVYYEDVIPNKEYRVDGVLMDLDTREPYIDPEGNEVRASAFFIASESKGSVDVEFGPFNSLGLEGKTLVCFEEIYLLPDERLIGQHSDIADNAQMVTFAVPELVTNLRGVNGSQVVDSDLEGLVDTVSYKNLSTKLSYTVQGEIYDYETDELVCTAQPFTFQPESSEGWVRIAYNFDLSSWEGHKLYCFEKVYAGDYLYVSHEDKEDIEQQVEITFNPPVIQTNAFVEGSEEGQREALSLDEYITINDEVSYWNLKTNQTYTLVGRLVDYYTAQDITEEVGIEFTPEDINGSVVASFTLKGSDLVGKRIVVYERLLDSEGNVVASHENVESEEQTLGFMSPSVTTYLHDGNGSKEFFAGEEAQLYDDVSYTQLDPEKTYTLTSILVERENQEELSRVVQEFTPDGDIVRVPHTLKDTSGLAGKDIVCYEVLSLGDQVLYKHVDPNDQAQIVHFHPLPENPELKIEKWQYRVDIDEEFSQEPPLLVKADGYVTYMLKVTNVSDRSVAEGIKVRDTIPDGLELVEDEDYPIVPEAEYSNGELIWNLGDLDPLEEVELNFTVKIPVTEEPCEWVNGAVVSFENDPKRPPDGPPPEEESNKVKIYNDKPHVSLEKYQSLNNSEFTKDFLDVVTGDLVTYRLVITSDGIGTATEVIARDVIPQEPQSLELENIGQDGVLLEDGITLEWQLGDIPEGESRTVEFTVRVPEGNDPRHWENMGTVTTPTIPEIESNRVEIKTSDKEPHAVIEKSQSINNSGFTKELQQVSTGDQVTYRLDVHNDGEKEILDILVRDQIPQTPQPLELVSIDNEGTLLEDGITIQWLVGSLAVGETKSVYFTVSIPAGEDPRQWDNMGTLYYTEDGSGVRPDNPDGERPEESDKFKIKDSNKVEIETSILPAQPHLVIYKEQSKDSENFTRDYLGVGSNNTVTYKVIIENDSNALAENFTVTDVIPQDPDPLELVPDSISNDGILGEDGKTITWNIDSLEAGASLELFFSVVVPSGTDSREWANTATLEFEGEKTDSNTVKIGTGVPSLSIIKEQSKTDDWTKDELVTATAETINYRLTVTNTSTVVAKDVVITDAIPTKPQQLELVADSISDEGMLGEDGITITWNVGDLAGGESKSVTFAITVPAGSDPREWENIAYADYSNNPTSEELASNIVKIKTTPPAGSTPSPSPEPSTKVTPTPVPSEPLTPTKAPQNPTGSNAPTQIDKGDVFIPTGDSSSIWVWWVGLAVGLGLVAWLVVSRGKNNKK